MIFILLFKSLNQSNLGCCVCWTCDIWAFVYMYVHLSIVYSPDVLDIDMCHMQLK